jgi:hypothetical protein
LTQLGPRADCQRWYIEFSAIKPSVRRNLHACAYRTRNSRALQPTISVRILRQILLVIVLGLEGSPTEMNELCRCL